MKMLPIVSKLIDQGVSQIRADFSGEGDSGEVTDIGFFDFDEESMDIKADDFLENYIYEVVDNMVNDYGGDWVNNSGGYGHITIELPDMKIEGQYYQNTIDEYTWSGANIFK